MLFIKCVLSNNLEREDYPEMQYLSDRDYGYCKTLWIYSTTFVLFSQIYCLPSNQVSILESAVFLGRSDIALTPAQAAAILELNIHNGSEALLWRRKRQVQTESTKLWDLPIFYKLENSYEAAELAILKAAISHITQVSCIPMIEVNANASLPVAHISFIQHQVGCVSYIGRVVSDGKFQPVSLPYYCLKFGTAVHEILHALGVWHEHQRLDRDTYIWVDDDAIRSDYTANFQKTPADGTIRLDLPYDYNSIMHYGSAHGSINGSTTITTRDAFYQQNLGQRHQLSFLDARALNMAYCADSCKASTIFCKNGGYADPKNCATCRCPPGLTGNSCETTAPSVGDTCGYHRRAHAWEFIVVQSPSFDHSTINSTIQCNWLIEIPENSAVSIGFSGDFHIPNPDVDSTCYNWLEITAADNLSQPGYRFCGQSKPGSFTNINIMNVLIVYKYDSAVLSARERSSIEFIGFTLNIMAFRSTTLVSEVNAAISHTTIDNNTASENHADVYLTRPDDAVSGVCSDSKIPLKLNLVVFMFSYLYFHCLYVDFESWWSLFHEVNE